MRIKENRQYISSSSGNMIEAKNLFRHLRSGESRFLGERIIGKSNQYKSYVTGLKTKAGKLVILLHSNDVEDPCEAYLERWQIEHLFKALKSAGFNLENTHVADYERLNNLLCVVAIAYCLAYKMGKILLDKKPQPLKKHGYKPKSIIRYGIDFLINLIRGCKKKINILVVFLESFQIHELGRKIKQT